MTAPTAIFGADQLDKMLQILPPADEHRLVVVAALDREGVQAVADFASKNGMWHLQAAYRHDIVSHDDAIAGRVIFKL